MGKQVTVASNYSGVTLPSTYGYRSYGPGQSTVLTDAEYAALSGNTLAALTVTGSVADPYRKSSDPNSRVSNVQTGVSGAVTVTVGFNDLTLTGNVTSLTVAAANASAGVVGPSSGAASFVQLLVRQDATGGRTLTPGAAFKRAGGSLTLSTGANAIDYIVFVSVDGGQTWNETDRSLNLS